MALGLIRMRFFDGWRHRIPNPANSAKPLRSTSRLVRAWLMCMNWLAGGAAKCLQYLTQVKGVQRRLSSAWMVRESFLSPRYVCFRISLRVCVCNFCVHFQSFWMAGVALRFRRRLTKGKVCIRACMCMCMCLCVNLEAGTALTDTTPGHLFCVTA